MNPQTRTLLEAVLEAIDIPAPATVGDGPAYSRLLEDRVLDAIVFLHGVLGENRRAEDGYDWDLAYLRRQLAANPPTTYRHFPAPAGGELL